MTACRVAQPPSLSSERASRLAPASSSGCHRHPPDSWHADACQHGPPASRATRCARIAHRAAVHHGRDPTARRRAGAGLRGREVGAGRPSARLGLRRRRRGDRVARGRALVADARHAPPAADRDAAADPRDHPAAHHAAGGHPPSPTRTRSRRVRPRPRACRSRAGRRRLALPRGAPRRVGVGGHSNDRAAGLPPDLVARPGRRGLLRSRRGARPAIRAARRVGALDRPGPRPRRDAREPLRRLRRRPRPGHRARLRLVERTHAHRRAHGARRGRRRARAVRRRAPRRGGCRLGRRSRIDHAAHVAPLRARRVRRVLPRIYGSH